MHVILLRLLQHALIMMRFFAGTYRASFLTKFQAEKSLYSHIIETYWMLWNQGCSSTAALSLFASTGAPRYTLFSEEVLNVKAGLSAELTIDDAATNLPALKVGLGAD